MEGGYQSWIGNHLVHTGSVVHSQHGPDDGPCSMVTFSVRFIALSKSIARCSGESDTRIHGRHCTTDEAELNATKHTATATAITFAAMLFRWIEPVCRVPDTCIGVLDCHLYSLHQNNLQHLLILSISGPFLILSTSLYAFLLISYFFFFVIYFVSETPFTRTRIKEEWVFRRLFVQKHSYPISVNWQDCWFSPPLYYLSPLPYLRVCNALSPTANSTTEFVLMRRGANTSSIVVRDAWTIPPQSWSKWIASINVWWLLPRGNSELFYGMMWIAALTSTAQQVRSIISAVYLWVCDLKYSNWPMWSRVHARCVFGKHACFQFQLLLAPPFFFPPNIWRLSGLLCFSKNCSLSFLFFFYLYFTKHLSLRHEYTEAMDLKCNGYTSVTDCRSVAGCDMNKQGLCVPGGKIYLVF